MTPWFAALPWVYYLDFKEKERYHTARFEKDTRYYVLRLSKDLLEDWVITLVNGRIKSKLGQSRTLAFANFNDAFDSFCQSAKIRHQRGYHLKSFDCDNPILVHLLPFSVHAGNNQELSHQTPQLNHQQMGFSF
ncbi:hypothetical protein TUM19329_00780 [Legionella antarctica]|uniref:Uncharacterized protein n=1 Tax=Legionella antarctica TaxID=2708020 RepID=A0A6F8T0L5_9GAMM|nr:WGR domain-containing protein [Legionella antarctica]BCA93717.1 hypothetical protein TUM19329_00780 [Legionella antarctica]